METVVQHHPYSASGASGWMSCPGKLVMEKGIPDKSSLYADEGSAAHFLASECLQNGKHPTDYIHKGIICWERPDGFDGQSFFGAKLPEGTAERSTWKITPEMAEHVGAYVDYVRGLVNGGSLLVEQEVVFGAAIGKPGAFGTSDAIMLSEDGAVLYVVDLKYGFKEVSSYENPQMLLYALGAMNAAETVDLEDLI